MRNILKFNDDDNWLNVRINDVINSYYIPDNITNNICVDIGGNVGAFSIVNNKKFKKIIAIEPSTYSYNEYKNNIKNLNINNVEIHQYAVSDTSNKILQLKPWKNRNESGNASTLSSEQWDNTIYENVISISIEDIFTKFKIDRINYLKVDCEGGEYDFLMNKDLSNIDFISIEIHNQLGEKLNELINYINTFFDEIESHLSGRQKHFIGTFKNKKINL